MTNPSDPHSHVLTTSQPCQVHNLHRPTPHINHHHHVWPLGEGGPNIQDNIIAACPTGHMNIHDLLSFYKMHGGNVPESVLRGYTDGERKYAKLGYDRMARGAM